MDATPPPFETLPREFRIVEVSAFAPAEARKATRSIESRIWKLAKTETLSRDIEALLLLIVGILGLMAVSYWMEEVLWFSANHSVGTVITHLLR